MLRVLVAEGMTTLLTTQYLDEADRLANSIVVIDNGRVIADGTPDELKAQVGGQVLHLRPVRPADLDAAHALVAEEAGPQAKTEGNGIIAPVNDPALMPRVVRRLDQSGIAVAELTLRRSSLDEVFIALTGHRAEPGAPPRGDTDADADDDADEQYAEARSPS